MWRRLAAVVASGVFSAAVGRQLVVALTPVRRQQTTPVLVGPTLESAESVHQMALQSENRAESTRRWYRLVITRFAFYVGSLGTDEPIALESLTLDNARSFLIYLRTAELNSPETHHSGLLGPRTIQEHARALKTFSRFCADEGLLETDPLARLKLPRAPKRLVPIFGPADVAQLLQVIGEGRNPVRDRAMLLFLLATGVRISELCGLQRVDVDVERGRAKVVGKGNKQRMVSFDPICAKALARYLAERGTGGHRQLFLSYQGLPLSRHGVGHLFADWGERTRISERIRCSAHVCRHSFAVCYLRAHPSEVFQLQALMGHEDLRTLKTYLAMAQFEGLEEGRSVLEILGIRR